MKGPDLRLRDTTLPIMPETGRELRRLLDLAATRHPQLQAVLLADPGAAVAVFRELERARPGSCEQVGDVAHAVALIGVEPFRRLIEALPEVADRGHASGPASAYSEAAHAACFAMSLAAEKGLPRHAELATAALLQHPAVLALAAHDPDAVRRAVYAVRDGVPVDVAFGAELGESLQDADQRLADAWALPALARQAMGDREDFNPRPQVVKLADRAAQTTATGWHGEHVDALKAVLADYLGVETHRAEAWAHRQAADAARRLGHHDYPLPAFELLLLPGGPDDDDIPMPGSPGGAKKPPPQTAPNLNTTLAGIMKRIHAEAGAARVVFAMLDRDRRRLRTRLALGARADDGIRRLDVDLAQKSLFSVMMGKPHSLWLQPDNAARYLALLPGSLRKVIDPQGAYMMSLFAGDRPLGLLYGDGPRLGEQGYRRFRDLCREAAAALTERSRVRPSQRTDARSQTQ